VHKAEALQFGFVDQIDGPAKTGAIAEFRERVRDLQVLQQRVGGILPQTFAAGILGLTRQRVWQLIESGDLETVTMRGKPYVTMRSLVDFGERERKSGRPLKEPTLREIAKAAVEIGKEHYEVRRKARKKS
jgi:hypothetical protein